MKKLVQFILPVFLLFYSCNMETEQNFARMARDEGIRKTFLTYSAKDAVLMRNNTFVIGKNAISEHFINQTSKDKDLSLTWKPGFVDIVASGVLNYTYGHYTFSYIDSSSIIIESKGVFHTIWKRQPDGTWRFVWD